MIYDFDLNKKTQWSVTTLHKAFRFQVRVFNTTGVSK